MGKYGGRPERSYPLRAGSLLATLVVALLPACVAGGDPAGNGRTATPRTVRLDSGSATGDPRRDGPGGPPGGASRGVLTIVTGADRETDFQGGLDLARFVAQPASIDLEVLASKGATDNMHRLHADPKVDLAIVQYDVYKAFIDQAAKGSKTAAQMIKPMRVVAPLYTQEMYFIVRRDSDLQSVAQIRGRKINVGVIGSGSALTVAAVYHQLFNTPIAVGKASYLDEQKALLALTVDKSIDVVVIVAGQPTRLLADMKPAARNFIRLLAVDPDEPSSKAAFRSYFPAVIRASSYSQWLDADVQTLSVMSFLITSADKGRDVDQRMDAFAQSLCQNIGVLQQRGHPKWREVDVTLKLGAGWTYSPISTRRLERCPPGGRTTVSQ